MVSVLPSCSQLGVLHQEMDGRLEKTAVCCCTPVTRHTGRDFAYLKMDVSQQLLLLTSGFGVLVVLKLGGGLDTCVARAMIHPLLLSTLVSSHHRRRLRTCREQARPHRFLKTCGAPQTKPPRTPTMPQFDNTSFWLFSYQTPKVT